MKSRKLLIFDTTVLALYIFQSIILIGLIILALVVGILALVSPYASSYFTIVACLSVILIQISITTFVLFFAFRYQPSKRSTKLLIRAISLVLLVTNFIVPIAYYIIFKSFLQGTN